MTVGQLEARLRKLLGRLGSRDKETVLLAIEAIHDLSTRLHKEQQKNQQTTVDFDRPFSADVRPAARTVSELQRRVDAGELLSDREETQLHQGYHAFTRQKREANEPHTWDDFIAAVRALRKKEQQTDLEQRMADLRAAGIPVEEEHQP
jgi:hypothetical protein